MSIDLYSPPFLSQIKGVVRTRVVVTNPWFSLCMQDRRINTGAFELESAKQVSGVPVESAGTVVSQVPGAGR